MIVEKQLDLLEGEDLTSPEFPVKPTDEVMVTPDGGAEVTLEDQGMLEEAKAMGVFDEDENSYIEVNDTDSIRIVAGGQQMILFDP